MVVTFLSMLGQEAETGGVHRMLGICSEFERISKVVIEKAEKDNAGRRKRKSNEQHSQQHKSSNNNSHSNASASNQQSSSSHTPRPNTSSTTTPTPHQSNPNGQLSPHMRSDGQSYSPMTTTSHSPSPGMPPPGWSADFSQGDPMEFASFAEMTGFGQLHNAAPPPPLQSPPANGATFQQPLIPQDLYSLPASFDWDWAEMSGGAYPSVENGNFGDSR